MDGAATFTKLATLAFPEFIFKSVLQMQGNMGYFSAEYNLLHILHLISDQQNTGSK